MQTYLPHSPRLFYHARAKEQAIPTRQEVIVWGIPPFLAVDLPIRRALAARECHAMDSLAQHARVDRRRKRCNRESIPKKLFSPLRIADQRTIVEDSARFAG